MGVFSKFKTAKATGGARNYLASGEHRIRVADAKFDKSRKGVDFFAMEGTIVETTSAEPKMQPGERINWSTHADKDAYAGNVKQFFMACFNLNEQQVDAMSDDEFEEAMELLAGPTQCATNRLVHASCRDTVSKNDKEYVATQWVGVEESEQPGEPEPTDAEAAEGEAEVEA